MEDIEQHIINQGLSHLLEPPDPNKEYKCSPNTKSKKFTLLHKIVMNTSKHPCLLAWIDTYLYSHPEQIDIKNNNTVYTALQLA